MANTLRETVLERNYGAPAMASGKGDAGITSILDLVTHEDRIVRLIAVSCLDEAGGPAASKAMADALLDPDEQVRHLAATCLHGHPDAAMYPKLMQIYDESDDGYVRQQIPMIVARNDQRISDPKPLEDRWAAEQDEQAVEGLVVALSRLGNMDARKAFIERLHGATGRTLDRYLKHCDYIHQNWIVKALAPILGDKTKLRYLGPHGMDVDLRACDIAVNLIVDIAGKQFSFPCTPRSNYQDGQLAEVKKFADASSG